MLMFRVVGGGILGSMRTVVLGEQPAPLRTWLEQRRALGLDRHDEVWEGEYHVAPEAHGRHGDVQDQVSGLLRPRARAASLRGSGPLNLGRPDDYRVPDAAYLRERATEVWSPKAAVVVEVLSPGDESYAKLGFYHRIGVEEVLIVDPLRRAVEWYGRGDEGFERAGASRLLSVSEAELAAEIDWPPVGEGGT
jgi:Uma2 family endonuclease